MRVDLINIIETILAITPQDSTVDVSQLQDANRELQAAGIEIHEARERLDTFLQMIKQAVTAVGVLVVLCAVTSSLSLVTRVWINT